MQKKEFYFLDEVAALTGIKEATLKKRAQRGGLSATKQKSGKDFAWVVPQEVVDALLSASGNNEYSTLVAEWEDGQKYGTHSGKRLKQKSIDLNSLMLKCLWERVQIEPSIQGLSAETLSKVMWKILENADEKNDHFSLRLNTYKAVTSFYKLLIAKGLKTEVDLLAIKKLKPKRGVPERRTSLSKSDLIEFFKANNHIDGRTEIDRDLNNILFMFYVCLGLRLSEPLILELDWINLETGRIEVLGKNNKWRTVYANQEMLAVIKDWISKSRPASRLPYLLLTKDGEPVTATNVQTRFDKIRTRAKLSGKITIHGLRRTFATFWMDEGKPIHDLKEILGHEKISTTDIYIRPDKEKAAQSMRDMRFGVGLNTALDSEPSPSQQKKKKRIRDAWG